MKSYALHQHQRGSAAIEFVMIAGLFLTTVLACFELTRLMVVRGMFEHALAETVRTIKVKPVGTDFSGVFQSVWQEESAGWQWLQPDAELQINA